MARVVTDSRHYAAIAAAIRQGTGSESSYTPEEMAGAVSAALEEYAGPYEVTPGAAAQTLETAGLRMGGDVVIAPIPRNYGLITYNGFELTVS